jgi:hypothetical protein
VATPGRRRACILALGNHRGKSFQERFSVLPPIWPEGNVTFGYLSTLNTWAKRFNFLLLISIVLMFKERAATLALAASLVRELIVPK